MGCVSGLSVLVFVVGVFSFVVEMITYYKGIFRFF